MVTGISRLHAIVLVEQHHLILILEMELTDSKAIGKCLLNYRVGIGVGGLDLSDFARLEILYLGHVRSD